MSEIICTKCGESKFSGLFTQGQAKSKYPNCMLCVHKRNKANRVTTPVPSSRTFNSFAQKDLRTYVILGIEALRGIK